MKVLFIGGTGTISTAVSRQVVENGLELYLLNRGLQEADLSGSKSLRADIRNPEEVRAALDGLTFDVVVNWIAFTEDEIERDLALFSGRTGQYIFISSASVYQKPPSHYVITESTPLYNPYWDYSRNKIACEERLNRAYREVKLIRDLAPSTANVYGKFSVTYKLKGEFAKDMSPKLETLNGGGIMRIAEAKINGMKLFEEIAPRSVAFRFAGTEEKHPFFHCTPRLSF